MIALAGEERAVNEQSNEVAHEIGGADGRAAVRTVTCTLSVHRDAPARSEKVRTIGRSVRGMQ
jgi:hypothetical protein